jgi:hypothetical protein
MGKFTEGLSLSRHGFFMLCIVAMTLSLFGAAGCGGENNARSSGGGGENNARSSGEAFIKASPNPVAIRGELGKTTIGWDTDAKATDGNASWGQVYVSQDGKQEALFAEGAEGSQEAPWIQPNATYEFRLYAGTERATLLDKVKVKAKAKTSEPAQESTTKEKTQANGTEKELSTTLLASAEDGLSILLPTTVLLLLIGTAVLRRR